MTATADRDVEYLVSQQLGKSQSLTPEGYLLCKDVPIARTGVMSYKDGELPGTVAGPDGILYVDRTAEELFSKATIASFEGKDITNEHQGMLTPETWRENTCGHVQNVHRGEGIEDDFLFGDFLIKDPDAITAVRERKREVSCGYDAQYEQIEPGRARQHTIIGNHVALVDRGRCGPRCAIQDEDTMANTKVVTKDGKGGGKFTIFANRLRAAFLTQDEEAFNKEMENAAQQMDSDPADKGGSGTEVHVHLHNGTGATAASPDAANPNPPNPDVDPSAAQTATQPGAGGKTDPTPDADPDAGAEGGEAPPAWFVKHVEQNNARFDAIEKKLGMTADEGITGTDPEPSATGDEGITGTDPEPSATGDEDPKEDKKITQDAATMDSRGLQNDFTDTIARAEILLPGIALPTFDSKTLAKKTNDTMCALRRKALDGFLSTQDGAGIVAPFVGGKTTGLKFSNNKAFTCDGVRSIFVAVSEIKKRENNAAGRGTTFDAKTSATVINPRSMNERNREFWNKHSA
jgi:hypothetical protein